MSVSLARLDYIKSMKSGHQYCSLVYPPSPTQGTAHRSCLINICGRKRGRKGERMWGKGEGKKRMDERKGGKKERREGGREEERIVCA